MVLGQVLIVFTKSNIGDNVGRLWKVNQQYSTDYILILQAHLFLSIIPDLAEDLSEITSCFRPPAPRRCQAAPCDICPQELW